MISFKQIKVGELKDFVQSIEFKELNTLPITPIRALSQALNPNADLEDVALIYAFSNNQLLGFIGILPWQIDSEKIYFNTCWWIDPEKGQKVSMPLFYQFLKLTKGKNIFFELTNKTEQIVSKLGKYNTSNTKGTLFRFGTNFQKWITPNFVFKTLDQISSSLSLISIKNSNLTLTESKELPDDWYAFIEENSRNDLLPKTKQELDWISSKPWMTQEIQNKKYPFSWQAKSYTNHWIKLEQDGKIIAIAYITMRDNFLKIPFIYFSQEASISEVIKSIIKHLKPLSFFTARKDILETLQFRSLHNTSIAINRAFYSDLNTSQKIWQDGDGDAAFT